MLAYIELLQEAKSARKLYEKHQDLTGERFNVFNILGLESREVRTHSAFIAELLNPKGTHAKEDTYLKIFIKELENETGNKISLETKSACVEVEKHAGRISENYSEGGNIDIILHDNVNNAIIIENKIYAGDQRNQMERYWNYGDKHHKGKFRLLYLTLWGESPSSGSTGSLKEGDYSNISYCDFIVRWLEKCLQHTVTLPIVRETIIQYNHLIKQLTNQLSNSIMDKEITQRIVSDEDSIKAFFDIRKTNVNEVFEPLREKLECELIAFAKDNNLEHDTSLTKIGDGGDAGYIKFDFKNSKHSISLGILCCAPYRNFHFFIDADGGASKSPLNDEINKRIGGRAGGFNEVWVQRFRSDLQYWDNSPEAWVMIKNGDMAKYITGKFSEFIKGLEGIEENL